MTVIHFDFSSSGNRLVSKRVLGQPNLADNPTLQTTQPCRQPNLEDNPTNNPTQDNPTQQTIQAIAQPNPGQLNLGYEDNPIHQLTQQNNPNLVVNSAQ